MTQITLQLSSELTSETGRLFVHDLRKGAFTLGRSPHATWRIIDESNQVSGLHLEIALLNGVVVMTDTSSGGTSLDDPRNHMTRGQPTPLKRAAVAYLPVGSLRIDWEDDRRSELFAEDTLSSNDVEADYFGIRNKRSRRGSDPDVFPEPGLGVDEDARLGSVFSEVATLGMESTARKPAEMNSAAPVGLSGEAWLDEDDEDEEDFFGAPPEKQAPRVVPAEPEPAPPRPPAAAQNRETEEPTTVSPTNPPPQPSPPPVESEAMRALFGALSIDIDTLSERQKIEMAAEIGHAFHAMADAMRRMLDTRREVKRTLGVRGTEFQPGANPLKVARDGASAAEGLLRPFAPGFLHGREAVEDALNSMQAHQMALVGGIRTAIRLSLEAFDPEELETRFRKRGLGAVVPAMRKAELWDRFVENYRSLADQVDSDIRSIIGKELDRLYDSKWE